MSPIGTKRTYRLARLMSALEGKTDMPPDGVYEYLSSQDYSSRRVMLAMDSEAPAIAALAAADEGSVALQQGDRQHGQAIAQGSRQHFPHR
jgi:hypothetical protein